MDRKNALKGIFSKCVSDLDLQQDLNDEAVTDKDIARVLDEYVTKVSEVLSKNGFPVISSEERAHLQFLLGQRRVNVKRGDQTVVLQGDRAEPWLSSRDIDWKFWENYCRFLELEGKSPDVIQNHEVAIERALELSGDPTTSKLGPSIRRGLVMGNVQSGKTLNFIGLLNKALDVGYHTIIVLGGHMNELRAQAQDRIDAGVIHVHDSKDALHSGLVRPHALTTKEKDFSVNIARSISPNLAATPTVYVVKKHPGILERLEGWFTEPRHQSVLTKPLLLIDDEADYASINTMQSQTKFTRTNETIRKLLGIFVRATYVAYTATPFANVFIPFRDQASREELDDLFPADFMIKMPIPANYVGQDFFFAHPREDDSEAVGPCRLLNETDHESWLKLKHKKDDSFEGLYWRLEDAIRCFLCVIALKDLRGLKNQHNTMLVNVSRFNLIQQEVALNVQEFLEQITTQLRAYGALGEARAVSQSAELAALRRVFRAEFSDCGHNFAEVLEFLAEQSRRRFVTVELVNGLNKPKRDLPPPLDYAGNEAKGLWVIAIGGLKLSRGLTLEGLSVSYFYRNALAYDTLTQMCRWFGYRDGYKDLCRLFLLEGSYDHYFDVARAIRGLYEDLKLMQLSNGTPRDFGLRVRTSDTALMITAKNKLGTAKRVPFALHLWGAEVNSLRLHVTDTKNSNHFNLVEAMVQRLDDAASVSKEVAGNGSLIFRNAPYGELFDFVSKIDAIFSETKFQKPPILGALDSLGKKQVGEPTVIVFSRSQSTRAYPGIDQVRDAAGERASESADTLVAGHNLRMITRSMSQNKKGEIYSRNILIGDSDDLKMLFSTAELARLHVDQDDSIQNKHIREGLVKAPVLVIYLLRAVVGPKGDKRIAHTSPSVAFTLHFPRKRPGMPTIEEMETTQEYFINEILQGVTEEDMYDDDHQDDEY